MITFAEEFLLLAHDEKTGDFADVGFSVMSAALAGAALMDLALLNRIDMDTRRLVLINRDETGEPVLDFCLARIVVSADLSTAEDWVDELSRHGEVLRSPRSTFLRCANEVFAHATCAALARCRDC